MVVAVAAGSSEVDNEAVVDEAAATVEMKADIEAVAEAFVAIVAAEKGITEDVDEAGEAIEVAAMALSSVSLSGKVSWPRRSRAGAMI